MNWTKGFSSRYYISIVDKDTWRDIDRIEITGGSIKRSMSSLRQSADIDVVNFETKEVEPLIRVWLDARQSSDSSHTPLFTGLATSPSRNINGRLVAQTLQCYSVLKPADDVLLPRGWYAPVDVNAIEQIKKLLKVTKAPVEIDGDNSKCILKNAIIAEQNETHLSMVEVLLASVNWRMVIDGYGRIWLRPYPETPEITFDSRTVDIIEPQITDNYDWFECPNVLRAIADGAYAEARDDDPESPMSIARRKREVWVEETSCNLNEKETLAGYAQRRLKELQHVGRTINYDRRYILLEDYTPPRDLNVTDIIRLNYPAQNIVGDFVISDQSITLGFGAKTSEEVMQI